MVYSRTSVPHPPDYSFHDSDEFVLMNIIDWIVLFGTLLFIAVYGIYKTRNTKHIDSYIKGENKSWITICLGVMATQASAVTFLSLPGQAYDNGMRFVQFYLGLPIAMIIISAVFIPLYYKMKVYTAYEFLENRFDYKTRALTVILFFIQRCMGAGITIYAPAIILSQLLHWDLNLTIIFLGLFVTLYIVSGGARAIAVTQRQQMTIIFLGMFVAFGYLVYLISEHLSFSESIHLAGDMGKMHAADYHFDWNNKYTIWSGIIGGLFLQLSYFGTDQSQVGRYLGGESIKESRLGLLFNGLLKIPMQFFILLCGVLLFVFYQYTKPPVYFDTVALDHVKNSEYAGQMQQYRHQSDSLFGKKIIALDSYSTALQAEDELQLSSARNNLLRIEASSDSLHVQVQSLVTKINPDVSTDHDYVFMTFVMNYLPVGLVGLLFAVIFSASMGSKASELNALASTFIIDIYKRKIKPEASENHYLRATQISTLAFGIVAIAFALFCTLFDNLIEAVNIIGSLFYGTILGIFLTAFFLKKVKGSIVFTAGLITEAFILYIYYAKTHPASHLPTLQIEYLWYNAVGCLLVIAICLCSYLIPRTAKS